MKIDKGYTREQFIDKLECDLDCNVILHNEEYDEIFMCHRIILYNDYLKQALNKEMFVNELKKPLKDNSSFHQGIYDSSFNEWKEAESKVIFKPIKHVIKNDNHIFIFNNSELWTQDFEYWYNEMDNLILNLGDLFGKTGGELELKNIDL